MVLGTLGVVDNRTRIGKRLESKPHPAKRRAIGVFVFASVFFCQTLEAEHRSELLTRIYKPLVIIRPRAPRQR